MKKFTFKSVLDGFRSSVQAAPRGADQEIQETLRPEHFQLKKTFRHGFPFSPTAMAWDPVQKLLAIGDKSGSLRILGRAGVDAHVRHEEAAGAGACGDLAVLHVHFLVNEGALVTATADDVLHLWNFKEKTPQVVQSIKFQRERITCLQLPLQSKWLHVGTERGNVHVVHIDTFVLSGYVINWNKAIEVTRGNHPGAVVQIIDSPLDPSKLLIAFESGLVVVWDLRQRCAEFRGQAGAALRGAAWHPEGKQFLSSHTDGALATWTLRTPPKPTQLTYPHAKANKEGKLEGCKPIHKVEWKTSRTGETYVVFSGGLPTDKSGRSPSITVVSGKTTTVLEMESNVVDFITLCESPWTSDYQDPYAIVVLLQNDLVVIDLLSPGYPCFENPYPMDVHESPVTCCSYLADCPSDLIPAFYSVGRQCSQQKVGFSENEWPINGGEWAPASCSYSEIILTGHADGSVKFWDASAGTLQVLYKLKSSKVFERRAGSVAGALPDEESPLSVQLVALCAESRRLAVAVAAAHVVLFKFRKTEIVSETHVIDVPLISDLLEESDNSPDSEVPRAMPVRSAGGQDSMDNERRGTLAGGGEVRVRGAQGTGGTRKAPGFQATLVCLQPCAGGAPNITALTLNSSYGLMAYGGEKGIVIVDVSRKCIVAALAPASLYGSADPWGRAPHSTHTASRRDTVTSEQRSPSIDQLEEALAELAGVPRTSPPPTSRSSDTADDSQEVTPVNSATNANITVDTTATAGIDGAVEVADEAYLVLTPTEAVAIPRASGSPKQTASLPGTVALVGSDERNKIEAAQCRRKSSTWKGFNLKRQLSKVDLKFKNTFSLPPEKKESEASQAKPGSVFYCTSSEITPLSPTDRNSDTTNRENQSKPESTQVSPDSDTTSESTEDKKELKDTVSELTDNMTSQKSSDMYERMHRELRDTYGWREDRNDSATQPDSTSQSPPKADVSERRVTIDVVDGVHASRPDNLPLFDDDGRPVRPPRHSKKSKIAQGEREKREQRLLSVPNIKYKPESILRDLRKRDAQPPSAPSFAGNIIRRFSRVDKLDSSFSRSRSSSMSSLENISSEAIQCLAFADSYTKKTDPTMLQATLWIGTSLGSVLTIMINLPEADSRHTQPVVISNTGGPIFRLKGSILAMSFLDCNGALIPYSYECWRDENKEQGKDRRDKTPTKQSSSGSRMSPTPGEGCPGGASGGSAGAACGDRQFVVIASEKQARVVALPSQNCVYRQQIADTDFVVKAEIVSLKDSVCLVNYISTGHLVAYSLPSLRPLIDVDFLPLAELRIAKTFCFSNKGHGLYLSSPTELQKFTIDTEFCQSLNDMMGELFLPRDMPEPPKESFFKGLFGGGSRQLDREELFGEQSGKASRAVAKHLTGPAAEMTNLGQRASTATSEVSRAHQLMLERGDKLGVLEERTERMHNQAQEFGSSAHQLMLKYKDKKWYQL